MAVKLGEGEADEDMDHETTETVRGDTEDEHIPNQIATQTKTSRHESSRRENPSKRHVSPGRETTRRRGVERRDSRRHETPRRSSRCSDIAHAQRKPRRWETTHREERRWETPRDERRNDSRRKADSRRNNTEETQKLSQITSYTIHKTAAEGVMNVAQFSMNISQLKRVLDTSEHTYRYFYLLIVLISISITMQVFIGVVLLIVGVRETKAHHEMSEEKVKRAMQTNRYAVALMFVVSCLNIVISIFYASVP